MATNPHNFVTMKPSMNIDQLFKKLNKTTSLNDARLKRQISIDKKRYEQGLELENKINNNNQQVVCTADAVDNFETSENNIKIEINFDFQDLTNAEVEILNDEVLESELNDMLSINNKKSTESDVEIIEIEKKKQEIIVLSDDDSEDDADLNLNDESDDVIILDRDEFAEELRNKLTDLRISKIVKFEEKIEDDNKIGLNIKQEPVQTTAIMLDSMLGTISGQNDAFINELAQQLALNLNLPVEFMTLDEFNKYKESQAVMASEKS